MGKVIILEGPDGGGKTTLANKLMRRGFRYHHEGPPPDGKFLADHYLRILETSLESPFDHVHDRLWLGERVYGPVARGVDRLGDEGQRLLMRLHNSKRVAQVVCLPNRKTAEKNYRKKIRESGDYLKSESSWKEVYNLYVNWVEVYGGLTYDYTQTSIDEQLLTIGKCLDRKELPKGLVGSRNARYLIITDQKSFTASIPLSSLKGVSGFTNKAIELAGLLENDIALLSTRGSCREVHYLIPAVHSLHRLEEIFFIGDTAKSWYTREARGKGLLYKTRSFPSSSYIKRYRGNNPELYAQEIKKVLNG